MGETARYVAYFRMQAAGEARQRDALARQRAAVAAFLEPRERILVGEFTEPARRSGGDSASETFALAIERCRALGATLVAALPDAALGPAARRAAAAAGIAIVLLEPAARPPENDADPALAAPADAPYLPLGVRRRPPLPPTAAAPAGNRRKADAFARAILPVIEQIRAAGATSLTDIAGELNARQIRTARGRRWYPATVRNVLNRARRRAGDA